MLILEQKSGGMVLVRRRPAGPTIIAGALFIALGSVALLPDAPLTPARLATFLVLASAGLLLIAAGLPRESLSTALPAAGRTKPSRLELTGAEGPDRYRAELIFPDGARRVVLERDEPAGVAADAMALAKYLDVTVRPGWGLEAGDWSVLSSSVPSGAAPHLIEREVAAVARPLPRQRVAALTTLWAGCFVLVVSILMALSPYRSGITPSGLSVLLPGLSVAATLLIGVWLLGLRERLVLRARGIECSRAWFGRDLGPRRVFDVPVLGAFAVSPRGDTVRHLLVATGAEPLAFAAEPASGRALARAFSASGVAHGRAAE